ncbi:MAG: SDR family NAD(P)-dependent oxidoreductase [Rhodospirillales bacterium]|nr:SDR family NAD(P)-dependent oxidoreductase [Rhodospirillales bacterium]
MADTDTAIIVGVGPGLGASLVRTFAAAGLRVAVAARRPDRLDDLIADVTDNGGMAKAYECHAEDEASVISFFSCAASDLGQPTVAVYNAGAFVPNSILETSSEEFRRCWDIGCLGGFHVGKAAAQYMVPRGAGTIIFTGATAAHRGGARFHNLAVPKFGLRALAQSMARELGPQGIHIGHMVIDGLILSGKHAETAVERGEETLLNPDSIAENYLMLHKQDRTAWTLEMDLRPWSEKF